MVRFGTSGWRGIIGRELTFRRVRMVVQAILETLREERTPVERIVVGFDTRMLSEKFAATTAQLIASNGVDVELTPRQNPITHRSFDITNLRKAFPQFGFTPLDDGLRQAHAGMLAEAS